MKSLSTHLALRYLRFKGKDKNIAIMIKICLLCIAIGTFSLMLTLIITNGFEKVIHEKMQGTNSQIIIYAPGNQVDYENISLVLKKEFGKNIAGVGASSTKQAIIDQNKKQTVIFLKGIDPATEHTVTNIPQKIINPSIKPEQALETILNDREILIGYKMAEFYGLNLGDTLNIMIPKTGNKKHISLKKETVIIKGIFKIGLEEYDNNLALTPLSFLQEAYDEAGVDTITLKLHEPTSWKQRVQKHSCLSKAFWIHTWNAVKKTVSRWFSSESYEEQMLKKMRKRFPKLEINSWKELYPALVSSLKLEKYVGFFILVLISLVACMNMISLLFMQIQQKRRDIAIFKAMGMTDNVIRSIFLKIGFTITLVGSTVGLGFAALAGFLLERYPFISLPDVYYVSYLPARLDLENFIVVFIVTLILGFIATWIPAQRTQSINVSQVLRTE